MTRHHQHASTPATINRSPIARYISIFVLILTPILTIIAFSLTLAAIYSPSFAVSHPLFLSGTNPDGSQNFAINNSLTFKRSPFYTCAPDLGTWDDPSIKQNCTRLHALGGRGMAECYVENPRDDQLCQKVVASASLYVSGAVLIGLAFGLGFVVAGLNWKHASATTWEAGYSPVATNGDGHQEEGSAEKTSSGVSSMPTLPTTLLQNVFILFLVLGAICLVLAQILGVQALVNEQRPTASEQVGTNTRWFMGKGSYVYTSVAWLAAFLAAFTAAFDCGLGGR